MELLRNVTFHVKELTESQVLLNSKLNYILTSNCCTLGNLPPITVTGDHNCLHITFGLPYHLLEALPEGLSCGEGIQLCPVIFNTALQECKEFTEQYKFEQTVNENSFLNLRGYYRAVR